MAKKEKQKFDLLNVRKAWRYFRRLWPFLKPQWPQILLVFLGMAMYSGGYAMRLLVIGPFMEIAQDPTGLSDSQLAEVIKKIAPYGGILLGGGFLMGFGTFLKQYFTGYVQSYTVISLQRGLVDKVLQQPMSFFNREQKGALISRMTSNATKAQTIVKMGLDNAVGYPLTILSVMGVLIYTSPALTGITFLIFPIVMIPIFLFAGKIRKATKKRYKKQEAGGNFFHQTMDGIRVVKSYRLEDKQREEFQNVSQDIFRRARKVARYKGLSRFGVEITYNSLMGIALLGVGWLLTTAWFVQQGGLPMFAQFFAGLVFLYDPVRKLGHSINDIQESTAALDRAFELYDRKPEIRDQKGAKEAPESFESIKFDHVNFAYVDDRLVLRDIDFEIKRGQMYAFVGQSGMGKSTLLDLIPRFYDPTSGAIRVDDLDLRDVKLESWLSRIAIVSQETFLFNTTIRDNIACGKSDASNDDVREAAEAANILAEIEALPEGFNTKLGDRGVNLSGGQRQRVAIARAFLRKAPILILDEATSSLDTTSEREVQKALDRLIENCTVFAVAHRLSTIRNADQILVINEGSIIEQGTHDELLARNGTYAAAYRLQHGEEEIEAA